MRPVCVVLAAGASTRMGSPKALMRVGGATAIERIVDVARACGLDVVCVTRPGLDLPALDARTVTNPAPDAGRTGSLQAGLGETDAREVLVWPVDHPLAAAATVRALVAASGEWVLPTHLGRPGHPIVVRDRAIDAIRRAAPTMPLRAIPPTLGIVPTRVDVDDPGILANLDTPADLALWTG